MGCMRKLVVQCTVPVLDTAPDETEEEPGLDRLHSAQNPPLALEVTAKGDVDQTLWTMSNFIMSIASNRFGIKEQHATKTTTAAPIPNRREAKIVQLRQELRTLRSQYKKASEQEKVSFAELRGVVQERLTTLRRAEWHRKKGKERARKHSAFVANPLKFTKKLLGEKRSG
ncbi:hypothetical protein SRHO_G00218690 [Serrasalmus rhombeus]